MAHEAITPRTDQELLDLLTPMAANISNYSTPFGITPTQVTQLKDDQKNVAWAVDVAKNINHEKEQITVYKTELLWGDLNQTLQPITVTVPSVAPGIIASGVNKRTMSLVKTIKANSNYTDAIGQLLGIVGAEKSQDLSNVKAEIKVAHSTLEGIVYSFHKLGADGFIIYGYTFDPSVPLPTNYDDVPFDIIAKVSHSPWTDERPNMAHKPETRLVKIRLTKGDIIVGLESDVVSVVATVYHDKNGNEIMGKVK